MGRWVLHNRYLPRWIHRLANGAIAGSKVTIIVLLAVRFLDLPIWILWIGAIAAVVGIIVNPSRTSFVEGCAGEVGYDELLDTNDDDE